MSRKTLVAGALAALTASLTFAPAMPGRAASPAVPPAPAPVQWTRFNIDVRSTSDWTSVDLKGMPTQNVRLVASSAGTRVSVSPTRVWIEGGSGTRTAKVEVLGYVPDQPVGVLVCKGNIGTADVSFQRT